MAASLATAAAPRARRTLAIGKTLPASKHSLAHLDRQHGPSGEQSIDRSNASPKCAEPRRACVSETVAVVNSKLGRKFHIIILKMFFYFDSRISVTKKQLNHCNYSLLVTKAHKVDISA